MDAEQAERLTEQAQALAEWLTGRCRDAEKAHDFDAMRRYAVARAHAVRRWQRRLDKWAVAAYGPEVN